MTKSLKDANYKVCAGALAATASAVLGAPDQFRGGILQGILPGVFDRLGDAKAPVRDAGRDLFLALMSAGAVSPAELVGEASPAWRHKNWRVREETLRVVERAFSQLDREIELGGWLWTDCEPSLIFRVAAEDRYETALATLGMSPHTVWMPPIAE